MKIYCKDLKEANDIFASMKKDGWYTDGLGHYTHVWLKKMFVINVYKDRLL